jgi:hypothetical protein
MRMGWSRRGRDGTTWNNIKLVMGDPFRVDTRELFEKSAGAFSFASCTYGY